jgi:hypothetical protein
MLKWNGKTVTPGQLGDELMKSLESAAADAVSNQLRQRISAIRHPETGEFPTLVVLEKSLGKHTFRVEGSPQLLQLVMERLTPEEREFLDIPPLARSPRAFLSYAGPDRPVAQTIAEALQAKGVDTWWAGWSLEAGHSLRQEIDKGLDACTHFIVLLTPQSIERPWVKEEMDAGLVLHVEGKCRFIALRHELPASDLPPLLRGKVSPSLDEDFEGAIAQTINDIHGITKKPPLGAPPRSAGFNTQYSGAANAVAKLFVQQSKDAVFGDPSIPIDAIASATHLTEDDVKDALHELRGMVRESFGTVRAEGELFATFDSTWMEWDPAQDALRIATDLVYDETAPETSEAAAQKYGWPPRRINPAIAYLLSRGLLRDHKVLGNAQWATHWLTKNDATRRFVKSRQS